METQTTSSQDLLYISCKYNKTKPSLVVFLLIEVNLIHDEKSYVMGMEVTHVLQLASKDDKNFNNCSEYALKYFEKMVIAASVFPKRVFGYCKDRKQANSVTFHFYAPYEIGIEFIKAHNLSTCLAGATYISATDSANSGFLSIIEGRVYEYYTVVSKGEEVWSQCQPTNLRGINYVFATSRLYANIQFHYFFLHNNTVIIKSSYKTNYQRLDVGTAGFNFTSYALS